MNWLSADLQTFGWQHLILCSSIFTMNVSLDSEQSVMPWSRSLSIVVPWRGNRWEYWREKLPSFAWRDGNPWLKLRAVYSNCRKCVCYETSVNVGDTYLWISYCTSINPITCRYGIVMHYAKWFSCLNVHNNLVFKLVFHTTKCALRKSYTVFFDVCDDDSD